MKRTPLPKTTPPKKEAHAESLRPLASDTEAAPHPDFDALLEKDEGEPESLFEGLSQGYAHGPMPIYRRSYDRIARNMRLLGYTGKEILEVFGISQATLGRWMLAEPTFLAAWRAGGAVADAKVARSLYKRAVGYSHEAVKIFHRDGETTIVPYTERFPPSEQAAIFWLTNRQRDRWKSVTNNQLSGANGEALLPPPINVMIVTPEQANTIEGVAEEPSPSPS